MGKLEEEVSQSEAALGPTCGQGVKCAPVSSLPPLPLFFFLSFTPLGCGLGRWEIWRSELWAQSLTGRRASTAVCQSSQGRGPFPPPPSQCLLPHSPSECLSEPALKPLGLSHQLQAVRGAGSVKPKLPWAQAVTPAEAEPFFHEINKSPSPQKEKGSAPHYAGTPGLLLPVLNFPREGEGRPRSWGPLPPLPLLLQL